MPVSPLRTRLRALFRRRQVEAELDEELRFHLEMETEKHLRAGVPPAEARRRARAEFGGLDQVREACRDERGVAWLEQLVADLRYGLRGLRRTPGFAAAAVLTLALGIGAATAVFSVVDGVLVRPLVYRDAGRLFWLYESTAEGSLRTPSYPAFAEWRRSLRVVSGAAYVRGEELPVRGEHGTQGLMAAYVSDGFFRLVGTEPLLGRTFQGGEASGERALVISHDLWRRRFGGDKQVVGRTMDTPAGPYTILGVMPRGFRAPFFADAWLPLGALPATSAFVLTDRDLHVDAWVLGRLAPGATESAARAELTALARAARGDPGWDRAVLTGVRDSVIGPAVAGQLRVLGAAVLLMLLVACVNVANLMLARATVRARELALRAALGARRGRLVRQLLAEGMLLAAAGGALGLAFAWTSVRALRAAFPGVLPRMDEVAVDLRVAAAALALSLGTTLVFGLVPALRATSPALLHPLRSGGTAGPGRRPARLRSALVVGQVALALALAVGAGLLGRSLVRLQGTDPGFTAEGALAIRLFPSADRVSDPAATAALFRRLREAAAAVPGVESAALANHLPLAGGAGVTRALAAGRQPPGEGGQVLFRAVSPEYFRLMGTRLLRGRYLGEADLAPGGGVLVNRAMARAFWGDEDPVGRTVTVHRAAQGRDDLGEPMTAVVVGVVEDERYFSLGDPPAPAVFLPYTWNPWPNTWVVVRAAGDPRRLVPALRRALLAVEPALPVDGPAFQAEFHTLDEYLARSVQAQRLSTRLLGAFGATALALATLGIAGVMAYLVARRTPEIGVRLALGARRRDVVLLVGRQALHLAGGGIVLGVALALGGTRLLRSQLQGISPYDPATYLGVGVLFIAAALLAALAPAVRAVRIPPASALRAE